MGNLGLWNQLKLHSHTSQFGQLTYGGQFVGEECEELMREAVAAIRDGSFAKRWSDEQAAGSPLYQKLLESALASPTAKVERLLFARLGRR